MLPVPRGRPAAPRAISMMRRLSRSATGEVDERPGGRYLSCRQRRDRELRIDDRPDAARPDPTRRRTLDTVAGHVIDGDHWITERLAYLRALLQRDLGDDERRTVEDEIAVLSKE